MKTQQKSDTTGIKTRRTPRGALLQPASKTIVSSTTTTASTKSSGINKSATTTTDHDSHAMPPPVDLPNQTTTTILDSTSMNDVSSSQDLTLDAEKHEARRIARRAKTSLSSNEGGARLSLSNHEENSMVDTNLVFTPGAYSVPGDKSLEEGEPNAMENVKADRGVLELDHPRMNTGQGQSTLSLIVAAELVGQVDDPNDEEWKRKIQQEVESRLMERDQNLTVAQLVLAPTNPPKEESTDQEQCLQCCWRWKFLLLFMVLCICGGMTGIIIWATGTLEPVSPTFAPTPSPTLDERQQKIMDILQKHDANLTNDKGDGMDDPNSPQSMALDWLLFNDTSSVLANLSNSSVVPPSTILERYGLAVLFFSTNGPLWKNRLQFLTERNVCDWNEEGGSQSTAGGSTTQNVPANLSDTYGVYCDVGQSSSSSSSSTQVKVVQQIRLSRNDLVGTIPSELGLLSHLQVLVLDKNSLEDGIPTELGQLTALQELILHTNNLDGTLPTELGQLTALSSLQLYTNNLLGMFPTELGNWTVLERFDIHDNRFTGTLPTEIGQWTLLEQFDLYRNYMGGTLPTELGLWQALTSLRAQSNVFYGTLPTELGQLTNLEQLFIYDNSLTGTVPAELATSNTSTLQVIFEPQNLLTMGGGIGIGATLSPTPETTSNATTGSSAVPFRQRAGSIPTYIILVLAWVQFW